MSNSTGFLSFVSNILTEIFWANNFLVLGPVSFKLQIFDIFYNIEAFRQFLKT